MRYTLNGFDCQLTLRAGNGTELLERAQAALKHLIEQGALAGPVKANGNHATADQPLADGLPNPAFCTIHNVTMKRHEKDGQIWYSHKAGAEFCRGKAKGA